MLACNSIKMGTICLRSVCLSICYYQFSGKLYSIKLKDIFMVISPVIKEDESYLYFISPSCCTYVLFFWQIKQNFTRQLLQDHIGGHCELEKDNTIYLWSICLTFPKWQFSGETSKVVFGSDIKYNFKFEKYRSSSSSISVLYTIYLQFIIAGKLYIDLLESHD